MTVYVDNMKAPFGRMKMCHMFADTTEELLEMVDKIGVARKWIQKAGTNEEHFDIAMSKRALAVQHGAVEVSMRCFAIKCYPARWHRDIGESQSFGYLRPCKECGGTGSAPVEDGREGYCPVCDGKGYVPNG